MSETRTDSNSAAAPDGSWASRRCRFAYHQLRLSFQDAIGTVPQDGPASKSLSSPPIAYDPDPTNTNFDPALNPDGIKNTVASLFSGDTAVRPDRIASVSYPKNVNQWFSVASFAPPGTASNGGVLLPGLWGNLPYGSARAPGRQNWNLSLFKQFILSEARGSRIEFRAESFNTWNHTQFGGSGQGGPGSGQGISTSFGASNFGHVTNAFDPRTFQLGLKIIY
jgi:hypothetical protein